MDRRVTPTTIKQVSTIVPLLISNLLISLLCKVFYFYFSSSCKVQIYPQLTLLRINLITQYPLLSEQEYYIVSLIVFKVLYQPKSSLIFRIIILSFYDQLSILFFQKLTTFTWCRILKHFNFSWRNFTFLKSFSTAKQNTNRGNRPAIRIANESINDGLGGRGELVKGAVQIRKEEIKCQDISLFLSPNIIFMRKESGRRKYKKELPPTLNIQSNDSGNLWQCLCDAANLLALQL